MNEHIEKYLTHITLYKACLPRTIKTYRIYLQKFFLETSIVFPEAVSLEAIRTHCARLDIRELNPKTKNLEITIIRTFLKYLELEQNIKFSFNLSRIPYYKIPRYQKLDLPNDDEVHRLIANTDDPLGDLIVNMLFDSGLRLSELSSIQFSQPQKSVSIVGKGGKQRVVFFSERSRALWAVYLRKAKFSQYLFTNNRGNRLDNRTIQRIIRARARVMEISAPVSPHTFRHLFATTALRRGAPLHFLKEFLGHSSSSTTERYLHLTNIDLEKAWEACHN